MKKKYRRSVKYYSNLSLGTTNNIGRRFSTALLHNFTLNEKRRPKVLWVGTDEGQDTSGLLQGLNKVADVKIFKNPNGYGQLKAVGLDAKKNRIANGRLLIGQTINQQQNAAVDIVIGQMWAYRMDTSALDAVRAKGIPVVNIAMDDRHAYWGRRLSDGTWGGTHGLIGSIDLACTAAPECVQWYESEGCPAHYLPEASDPDVFYPSCDNRKHYDVCFVGARYGIREQIVFALSKAGLNIIVYGNGWPNGKISAAEMPKLFRQSKIVLGVGTIGYCNDFYALKMRDFDGPMSGSVYLTHDNEDLYGLYNVGEEIVTYKYIEDCVRKAKDILSNPGRAKEIAKAGRQRALCEHTWYHRFNMILDEVLKCSEHKD